MGDIGRSFRPIAPRTMPPGGAGGQPPLGGSGPSEDGRMKRASTACKECQKRRTRCTGPPKCSECDAHGRECAFDEQADRRRKANARRTQEELATTQEFLQQILRFLGNYNTAAIQHFCNVIRSGASQEELQAVLVSLLAQHPEYGQQGHHHPHHHHHHHHAGSDIDPNNMGNFFDSR
ncbi:uncharacterized protein N7482_004480 [Penicillium canariense]|uniref:Zn(2)-C6 fungal-type domain-containing protein n=1 Tax=Penicillium canariense TaxID=189055 RepID=A0A9W9I8X6_9EURO|nr:uncharacterized protein N7482_004480 [Penicillium canariense]KAJ5168886.1 hypothetical protein N7482_004480 [Penicillium canariense]